MRENDIFQIGLQNQQAHTVKAIERRLHDELNLEPRKSASERTRELLQRASLDVLGRVEQCEEARAAQVPDAIQATGREIGGMAPALADAITRALISDYRLDRASAAKRRRLRELTAQEAARFMTAVRDIWAADRQLLAVGIKRRREEASREEIDQVGDPEQWDQARVQAVADKMLRLVVPGSTVVPPHRVLVERLPTDRDRMRVVVEIADGTRLQSDPVPLSVHFPSGTDSWAIGSPTAA